MKKLLHTAVSIAVLSASISMAHAEDFSYNYLQGEYQDIDLNGVDADAMSISGSYDVAPNLNIIAGYSTGEISTAASISDMTVDTLSVGLGYHAPMTEKTDFITHLSVINKDMDTVGDDTGYDFGVGVRHQVSDTIEIGANISYEDIYDANDTTFEVNSQFTMNKAISLGLSLSTSSEEVDTISANMRFNF